MEVEGLALWMTIFLDKQVVFHCHASDSECKRCSKSTGKNLSSMFDMVRKLPRIGGAHGKKQLGLIDQMFLLGNTVLSWF